MMHHVIKIALATALFTAMAAPAGAAEIREGWFACLTEDLLGQLTRARVENDIRARDWLLENGCLVTNGSYPATVLSGGLTTVHLRVYGPAGAVDLWTVREAVRQ